MWVPDPAPRRLHTACGLVEFFLMACVASGFGRLSGRCAGVGKREELWMEEREAESGFIGEE